MTVSPSVLVWFRRDLRLADQPALRAAAKTGLPVIPVYLHTSEDGSPSRPGAASRLWLHQSLLRLDVSLQAKRSRLVVRRGPAADTLPLLAAETNAQAVFLNRVLEPAALREEQELESGLRSRGIRFECFHGGLLFEPGSIRTTTGGSFQVFTPFWRACWNERARLRLPEKAPATLSSPECWPQSLPISDLRLEPETDWAAGIRAEWTPGEEAARDRLRAFARHGVSQYGEQRDRTDREGTSRLSPHLHFGEVSPVQVWHATAAHPEAEPFLRQLAWREFAWHLLGERPDTLTQPFNPQFRHFPWHPNTKWLKAWQRGRTGYPFVDAGMRQLWATGWMHNRARLVVASFLVKHLLIPWQEGAAWFLDTLVDADLANNTMGWQWVAGCGVDAAPYFRIFNPVLQGEKFDPAGEYVRRWIPELRGLGPEWIHKPWNAPPLPLAAAGIRLGETYPRPLVDHATARLLALAALEEMHRAARRG